MVQILSNLNPHKIIYINSKYTISVIYITIIINLGLTNEENNKTFLENLFILRGMMSGHDKFRGY